jgi:hypothetical protein
MLDFMNQSSLGVRLEQMSLARYEAVAVTTEIQEEILREMGIGNASVRCV